MEEKNQPRRPRRSPEEPLQKNESLVYGKNPVTELLKSGSGVDTVLIAAISRCDLIVTAILFTFLFRTLLLLISDPDFS